MIQKILVKVSQQQQNFIPRQFHSNERFQKRQELTTIQTTGIDGLYIPRRWRNQIYQNYCIVLFFHLKMCRSFLAQHIILPKSKPNL